MVLVCYVLSPSLMYCFFYHEVPSGIALLDWLRLAPTPAVKRSTWMIITSKCIIVWSLCDPINIFVYLRDSRNL